MFLIVLVLPGCLEYRTCSTNSEFSFVSMNETSTYACESTAVIPIANVSVMYNIDTVNLLTQVDLESYLQAESIRLYNTKLNAYKRAILDMLDTIVSDDLPTYQYVLDNYEIPAYMTVFDERKLEQGIPSKPDKVRILELCLSYTCMRLKNNYDTMTRLQTYFRTINSNKYGNIEKDWSALLTSY